MSLLRFAPFELDTSAGELRKAGQLVRLQPQPIKVLTLLAAHAGRLVTREEIHAEVWSGDTFVDFEQGLNYCIKQIRSALGDDAKAPRYVETLQRRGYRFAANVEPVAQAPAPAGKVVLVVLPFQNLSGDAEQEYFSDGLTEEMITQLSRLNPDGLGVIARTSAMRYKATSKSIAEIGRELGVVYVMEGSVRRAGGRVRVTAQLIQVADQTHLWAQSYERDLDDILAIQSQVAQAIASEIKLKLTPREAERLASVRPVSTEAHEAYLRGRYFWYKRTEAALLKSIAHFEEAIAHEPNYAAAYDGVSDAYVMLACRGVLPVKETFQKARAAAAKALEIDGTLGEGYASLAHVRLHDWDWEGLDDDFRRALELNPGHAIAYYWYAEYLMATGRVDESIAMAATAHRMDPLAPVLSSALAMILYLARRYDEGIGYLRQSLEVDPDHFLLHFRLGLVLLQKRLCREGIDEIQLAVTLSGRSTETLAGLAQAYGAAGMREAMQGIVDELSDPADQRYVSPYNVSRAYAASGDQAQAFAWLEKAYDERNPDLIELRTEPVFDPLRPDPRFADLLRRVGWRV